MIYKISTRPFKQWVLKEVKDKRLKRRVLNYLDKDNLVLTLNYDANGQPLYIEYSSSSSFKSIPTYIYNLLKLFEEEFKRGEVKA